MEYIVPAMDLVKFRTGTADRDLFCGPARVTAGYTRTVLESLNAPPQEGNVRVVINPGKREVSLSFSPAEEEVNARLLYTSGSGWSSSVGDAPLFEAVSGAKQACHHLFVFALTSSPVVQVRGYNGKFLWNLVPDESGWRKFTP